MIGPILLLLLVVAGILFMLGAKGWGAKLFQLGIVAAVVVSVIAMFKVSAGVLWFLLLILAVVVIGTVAFRLRYLKVVLKLLWLYVKASYRLGARVIEAIIRFPPTLMPLPERLVVSLSSILIVQVVVALILCLVVSLTLMPVLLFLLILLIVTVGFGLLGRWRFLRQERKGLSNV